MSVTDTPMQPETLVHDWHTQPRGARIIANPVDVMFDYDDVIFRTMLSIHDLACAAGLNPKGNDPAWSGWESYEMPDGTPCPPEVYWDLWSDFALSGGYVNTPPIAEAAEAMRRLHFAGHRIHIVTARGFMAHADDIRRWTVEHTEEFAIPWRTLTFAQDKVAAQVDIFRMIHEEPAEGLRFDYAIDDSPKHVNALRDAGVQAYLLNHVHNKLDPSPWRTESVGAFVDMILEETA